MKRAQMGDLPFEYVPLMENLQIFRMGRAFA